MRNAVIVNGTGFAPCCSHCGSLDTFLERAHAFDRVQETSIACAPKAVNLIPDLVFIRFLIKDWVQQEMELCGRTWPSAKTFAVFCGGSTSPSGKVSAILYDVDDFIFCPFHENELGVRVKRLLKGKNEAAPSAGTSGRRDSDFLVGESESFLQAIRKARLLARSKAPVLISGETGSGKELFARAIHYQSARSSRPFIPVNCGALPDDLFENELFGHRKGAYTNATSAEKGLIAEAEGGTLFLDEVDALSPAAQIKLLRFLQSGEYRPLGCSRPAVADVRVIAATNTELDQRVEGKLFREDLHYRLNVLSLSIPALRERADDVQDLATHFLAVYAKEHGRSTPRLSEEARVALSNHFWPGNVRELEGVIQRAIVLGDSEIVGLADLDLPDSKNQGISEVEQFRLGKSRAIVQFERNFIAKLLATHGGNISHAARAAGKDRRSFQRLVNKYSLNRKSFESRLNPGTVA